MTTTDLSSRPLSELVLAAAVPGGAELDVIEGLE